MTHLPHAPALRVRARVARTATAATAALLATLFVSLALTVAMPVRAFAHAGLVSSDPAEGATLQTAPKQVTLEFTEPIDLPAYVVVTGPDGTTHQLDDPVVTDAVVTQQLDPATLAASRLEGAWTIAYRVVSRDAHPVQGHVRFRVKTSSSSSSPVPGESASTSMPTEPTDAPTSATPSGEPSTSPAPTPTDDQEDGDEPVNQGVYVVISAAALLAVVAAAAQVRRRTAPDDETDAADRGES